MTGRILRMYVMVANGPKTLLLPPLSLSRLNDATSARKTRCCRLWIHGHIYYFIKLCNLIRPRCQWKRRFAHRYLNCVLVSLLFVFSPWRRKRPPPPHMPGRITSGKNLLNESTLTFQYLFSPCTGASALGDGERVLLMLSSPLGVFGGTREVTKAGRRRRAVREHDPRGHWKRHRGRHNSPSQA